MSDASSEQPLPRQVEPRKFALHNAIVQGQVPGADLPRLVEASCSIESVRAELQFGFDERRPVVSGAVNAVTHLQCQRCLEPVQVNLDCTVALTVVKTEEQAKALPKERDPWLVPEDCGDLYVMLEEELLLAMPFVAFHDYDCVDAALFEKGPEGEPVPQKVSSPFGVLEQLKKPKKDQ